MVSSWAFGQENWPQFLGPEQNNHAVSKALPTRWSETENVVWKTAIPGEGWSSPVVFGKQIWLTTATDEGRSLRAIAVDKDSGAILHNIEVFAPAEPGKKNDFNSYASPSPVIEPGRVYVCFGANGSACIDTASGQIVWKSTELKIDHGEGAGSSPVLYKDLYILNCDGTDQQYVAALKKSTGKMVWKTPRGTEFGMTSGLQRKAFSTPMVIQVKGQRQLISIGAKRCAAYDPENGKELWFCTIPGFSNTPQVVYADGVLYITTGYMTAETWAIRTDGAGDVSQTHVIWKCPKSSTLMPTPLLVDGRIYMPTDSGITRCLDAKTGEQIWQSRFGPAHVASPLYANGLIYLFSSKGETSILKPGAKPEVIAKNTLNGRLMASPAVSGDALFLRTHTHLYRIESARREP
jgi:outer membrane protein assembly factor BamB